MRITDAGYIWFMIDEIKIHRICGFKKKKKKEKEKNQMLVEQ